MNISGNMPSNAMNATKVAKNELTQESFMKMLMTQLKLQNPLQPFDASTMMQQIAQLTGLSASQQLVKSVESLKENAGVSQVLEASQIVGKKVQLATNNLQLKEGEEAEGAVIVPNGVKDITVTIHDASGNKVRTMTLESPSEGVFDFTWDGLDDDGKPVEKGFYMMSAIGVAGGEELSLPTAASYQVDSVALDRNSGSVILNVEGLGGVSMDDVVKIL